MSILKIKSIAKIILYYFPFLKKEDKITTGKRKHEDDEPVFEQMENIADPSRCPVKMFECYLSRRYFFLKKKDFNCICVYMSLYVDFFFIGFYNLYQRALENIPKERNRKIIY